MKKLTALLALAAAISIVGAANAATPITISDGTGVVGTVLNPTDGLGCGTFQLNADGSYEDGLAWFGPLAYPDGAFAECYSTAGLQEICSVVLDLSTFPGYQTGQVCDVYVWDNAGGVPGNVVCSVIGLNPGTVGFWPAITRHVIDTAGCCYNGDFWVGTWAQWPNGFGWFVAADSENIGCCLTYVPGGGWQTGTQVGYPQMQSWGLGCETKACGPVATEKSTWGAIKSLYN